MKRKPWPVKLEMDAMEAFRNFSFPLETNSKGRTPMLWGFRKRQLSRGEKRAVQSGDNAKPELQVGKPGSEERIAAYAAFYADQTDESAFS